MKDYLQSGTGMLKRVMVVLDARHGFKASDLEFIDLLEQLLSPSLRFIFCCCLTEYLFVCLHGSVVVCCVGGCGWLVGWGTGQSRSTRLF